MKTRQDLLELGFTYTVQAKTIRGKKYTKMSILYHDEEIYYEVIHERINADILFINTCVDFLKI